METAAALVSAFLIVLATRLRGRVLIHIDIKAARRRTKYLGVLPGRDLDDR